MEGVDSEETLKAELEKNIKAHKEHHAEEHYIDDILDKAVSNMTVEIPDAMINEEIDRMLRQYE